MTATPKSPSPDRDASVLEALEALERGEVVGIPAETVYGLGARADSEEAMGRLLGMIAEKGGEDPRAPFSIHVGVKASLPPGHRAQGPTQRLMDRYWPGPLTLVVPGEDPGESTHWQAIRRPAHDLCLDLLDRAPFPIAIAAARIPNAPYAATAHELRSSYGSQVPVILDGGRAALGTPSTVLAIGPGRFDVLREGIVTAAELRRAAGLSILFVCTGNTCRSPMAEGICRAALREALGTHSTRWQTGLDETSFGFQVASAGVFAGAGSPPSENAVHALADRGIDLASHRSQPALDQLVGEADHVYCLTRSHRDALVAALPPGRAGSVTLLDPDGGDVPDPFGGPLEVYRATADAIEAFIRARLDDWV